jgi:hypothetical protein
MENQQQNIFIIDTPVSYFYRPSSIAREGYSHCTYVNTEGAQDLFMEGIWGAYTTAEQFLTLFYHHMALKVTFRGV